MLLVLRPPNLLLVNILAVLELGPGLHLMGLLVAGASSYAPTGIVVGCLDLAGPV